MDFKPTHCDVAIPGSRLGVGMLYQKIIDIAQVDEFCFCFINKNQHEGLKRIVGQHQKEVGEWMARTILLVEEVIAEFETA
ncbi:hypothetical protein Hamer_G009377 [Homarus americanus]|uniref:Uncharacterized protein n=1 Tax=Homarus americanus TaxID=6706 RepID=A0A8J5MJG6_HOMAM|nr:hypothetical protein Hamer_G009377 [Homarus americanus]